MQFEGKEVFRHHAVVTSTLSRTIETAFYGIPVTSSVSFFATELGRSGSQNICVKNGAT